MQRKTIGILGGLGPDASAKFYTRLISEFQKRYKPKSNTEYPHVVINSIPAPDFMTNKAEEVLTDYTDGLRLLEEAEVDYIVIVCNTAYNFLAEFREKIATEIIDLREETMKHFVTNGTDSYAIFGTEDTVARRLFSFEGMNEVPLTKKEIKSLTQAITEINLGNKNDSLNLVEELYSKYVSLVDVVLIACSEIGLVFKDKPKVLDTMDVLLESTLNKYEESK